MCEAQSVLLYSRGRFLKSHRGVRLSEPEVLDIVCELCLALHFLHEQKVLHRDIKAQNVFLQKKLVKIGDFGVSKVSVTKCLFEISERFMQGDNQC